MWKKTQSLIKSMFFMSAFLLFSFFVPLLTLYAEEPSYQMSASQLNELNGIIDRQENRLTVLQMRLDVLTKNSTEQNQALDEAKTQLNEALTHVTETRQNLKNANESLANAKTMIAKQEESLNQLEVLVKKLEHENSVLRKQRNLWMGVAGIAVYRYVRKAGT